MGAIDPVSASIEAAEGLFKIGSGIVGGINDKKASAELRKTRPKASMSGQIRDNLALAESELSNPDAAAATAWRESTDSALASSIGATLKGGGTPNDVASVFSNNAEGRLRMNQFREQLRQQKVANLSSAYAASASDEKSVFDYNSRQWFDDAQALAEKTRSDKSMLMGGVSDIGAAATNYATLNNQNIQTDKTLAAQKEMYKMQQDGFMQQMSSYFGQ